MTLTTTQAHWFFEKAATQRMQYEGVVSRKGCADLANRRLVAWNLGNELPQLNIQYAKWQ